MYRVVVYRVVVYRVGVVCLYSSAKTCFVLDTRREEGMHARWVYRVVVM